MRRFVLGGALLAAVASCGPNAFPIWGIDINTRATSSEVDKIDEALIGIGLEPLNPSQREYGNRMIAGLYVWPAYESIRVAVLISDEQSPVSVNVSDTGIYGTELVGVSCAVFKSVVRALRARYEGKLKIPYKADC